jgi:hypothetical protein
MSENTGRGLKELITYRGSDSGKGQNRTGGVLKPAACHISGISIVISFATAVPKGDDNDREDESDD